MLTMCQRIRHEVRVWAMLQHKNILHFIGMTSGFEPLPAFVTPWMEHGSLTNYLSLEFFNLSDIDKFILVGPTTKWFKLIILTTIPVASTDHNSDSVPSVLVHDFFTSSSDNSHSSQQSCHSWEPHRGKVCNFVDVYLTSAKRVQNNILIDPRGNTHVADFGLLMILAECDSSSSDAYYPGSIRWAVPELINLTDKEVEKPTSCSDIYLLGSVILQVCCFLSYLAVLAFWVATQVLSGKLPYHWLEDPLHIMGARHQRMQPMAADSLVDRHHMPFLQECWSRSSDRPTMDHVLSYVEVYFHRNAVSLR